jgi:hypothetical protein
MMATYEFGREVADPKTTLTVFFNLKQAIYPTKLEFAINGMLSLPGRRFRFNVVCT